MPDSRKGYIQKATSGEPKVYLTTGDYQDAKRGELVIETSREYELVKDKMNNNAIQR